MANELDPKGPRYQVLDRSDSAHCCFEATVVDVDTPTTFSDGGELRPYTWMCETFEPEDAQLIAGALNRAAHERDGARYWVIMGNDYPSGIIYGTEGDADAYVSALRDRQQQAIEDRKAATVYTAPVPRINWYARAFDVEVMPHYRTPRA